jgi:membrane fusion protein (multidrug efflux system)
LAASCDAFRQISSLSLAILLDAPAAYRVAKVRHQVSSIVLKRNFVEGSNIKARRSLYQIDPATYQAAYDRANGDLAKA